MSLVDYANEEEDNSPPHESELGADGAMNDDTLAATSADSETSAHTHNNTRAINEVDSKEDPHEDALASVAAYELAEEVIAHSLATSTINARVIYHRAAQFNNNSAKNVLTDRIQRI